MSTSSQGPPNGLADHQADFPATYHPVDQLRSEIRKMQDCLQRMSDAAATDLLGHIELRYLNSQLTHLGTAYVAAVHVITGVAMCAQIAAADVDDWDESEIVEATLPVKDDQVEGGAS